MDVGQILNTAFRLLADHYWRFVQALVLPFCFLVALNLATLLELSQGAQSIVSIVGLLVYAVFAVITHRLTILGPNSVPTYGLGSISKREILFIAYSFLATLPLLALVLPGVLVFVNNGGVLLLIPGLIVGLYVLARLSLVFPGIAVDRMVTLKHSWEMTRPHQRAMVMVVIVVPFGLSMILGIIQLAVGALLPVALTIGIASLANTLLLVFTITILSLTYRQIAGVGGAPGSDADHDPSEDETS